MGAFQIVYDDFSGGQYMGPRSTNQPKNTWIGENVLVTAKGELIPTGSILAAQYQGPSNSNSGWIVDHWVGNTEVRGRRFGFAFVRFDEFTALPNTYVPRESCIIKYQLSDGTAFPSTPTVYAITGGIISTGDVAFSSYTNSFYFVRLNGGNYEIVQFNINTGAFTTNATFTPPGAIEGIENYKYRLVGYSPADRRLYYSNTDKSTWNFATNYYEFDSGILRVEPRTDDLLVFTFDSVYSVTGVLGASVNIQQIIPATNMYEGMWIGASVNRSYYFMDELFTGPTDGKAYRLIGATVQQVASFQEGDYGNQPNGDFTCEDGKPGAVAGGRLSFAFKRGWVYAENGPNIYSRIRAATPNYRSEQVRQFQVGMPAYLAPTEYISYGYMDYAPSTFRPTFKAYRALHNVDQPTKLDACFSAGPVDGYTPAGTPSINATGTVQLPEYWHQKPFTVKEVFIEYKNLASASISIKVEPTGIVDAPDSSVSLSDSVTITQTTANAGDFVMYRYHPNNASKGFGAKPIITMTNTAIKRVVVNCED
jgi:hypothetical protein